MTSKILLDVQMASSLPTPEVDQFQLWAQLAGEDVLKQQSEDQELTIGKKCLLHSLSLSI